MFFNKNKVTLRSMYTDAERFWFELTIWKMMYKTEF